MNLARAVLAFLALPGTVAFVVPVLLVDADQRRRFDLIGLVPLLLVWGWAIAFRSGTLAIYALAVMAAFHLRVVFGEEPWLARAHGRVGPLSRGRATLGWEGRRA